MTDIWIVMEDGGYDGTWPLTVDGEMAGTPVSDRVVAGYPTLTDAESAAERIEAEFKDRQDIYRGSLFVQKVTCSPTEGTEDGS